jgi:hypothetical protein
MVGAKQRAADAPRQANGPTETDRTPVPIKVARAAGRVALFHEEGLTSNRCSI